MRLLPFLLGVIACFALTPQPFVRLHGGSLVYNADSAGNVLPDFSRVGYAEGGAIPDVPVFKAIYPDGENDEHILQSAIDELSKQPLLSSGYRGAIVLAGSAWKLSSTIRIEASGIVLRGVDSLVTLLATGSQQYSLLMAAGKGSIKEILNTRVAIDQDFVPLGAKELRLADASGYKVGDSIIVNRPATANWIHDLKMDEIEVRDSTSKQWTPAEYGMEFERIVRAKKGNLITLDQPIVMQMEKQYGGGSVYKYRFAGRIDHIGIENLKFDSEFRSPTDEAHGWNAILFNRIQNSWIRNVTSIHFGYSCVNLGTDARNVTVENSRCLDPISKIEGGRRYSFNNDGQMNLIQHCFTRGGRHDYVTGAKVRGPNVFYHCVARSTHADTGPHHRWAMGTLYDNIDSDGEINAQDRGNWGTGHGWSGVNQVFWNCKASRAAIQDPWVTGRNYVVGMQGVSYPGRLKGRNSSVFYEAGGIASLYEAQRAVAQGSRRP